jgi:hypothetical protein
LRRRARGFGDQRQQGDRGADRRLGAPGLPDESHQRVARRLQRDGQHDVPDDQRHEHGDEMSMQAHRRIGADPREHPKPRREEQDDRQDAECRNAEANALLR